MGHLDHRLEPQGSYSALHLDLEAEQGVRVEPASLIGMTSNVELGSVETGGLMALLQTRSHQPERRTRFQTTYTARGGPGQLMLAPSQAGEVYPMQLDRHALWVQSLNILAVDQALEIDEEVPNGSFFFSAEGKRANQYLVEISGSGRLFLAACGSPYLLSIPKGRRYLFDTGHIMAFEKRLPFRVRQATEETWLRLASDEGLVAEFEGPGEVLLQTRSASALTTRLAMFLDS